MTNFIRRVLTEESKAGKREWTLNEIINRMIDWYGEEVLKVKVTYIDLALRNLERQGVVIRTYKDGVEHIVLRS